MLRQTLKDLNIDSNNNYGLRHTQASLLLYKGANHFLFILYTFCTLQFYFMFLNVKKKTPKTLYYKGFKRFSLLYYVDHNYL